MRKIFSYIWILFSLSLSAATEYTNVLYVYEQAGISNIILYDTTTTETTIVTNFQDKGKIFSVSTNETGDTIVFTRASVANGRINSTVWSINTDGSSFSDLIEGERNIDIKYAAISPDGTKIVYSKNSLLHPDVYHLYLKTSVETRLLTSDIRFPAECAYPIFLSNTKILFLGIDLQDNRYDYYTVNTDGTEMKNITNNNQYSPYFPKLGRPYLNDTKNTIIYGKQIQNSEGFLNWRIYTLNLNTSTEAVIFNNLYYVGISPENQPDPQPFFKDGGEIGLIGTLNSVDFDLYFTYLDAANPYLQPVTFSKNPYLPHFFTVAPLHDQWLYEINGWTRIRDKDGVENNIATGTTPVFNWKGTYIAYCNSGINIRRIGATTSSTVETDLLANWPAFSPDDKWIAYVKNHDIWARLIDMSNSPRQLTNSPLIEKKDLCFSPDGRHILFTGVENNKTYVYRMPVSITYGDTPIINSTGLPTKLTADTVNNYEGSFSPDGKTIVFVSTRNQLPELWLMDADGRNQRKLIFNSSAPVQPAFPKFSPYDNNLLAYLTGTPYTLYTVDISQEFKKGNQLLPSITTTGRFSWGKAPSGNIDIARQIVFETYYPDIPLEYKLNVGINKQQFPASFIVEETVPETWILTEVKINGVTSTDADIITSGNQQTIKWFFGPTGITVDDTEIKLVFDLNGDTLGNSYWLTGGATVSDRKYLTTGSCRITIGQPCIPVDTDKNWQIDDFELLDSIDLWAKNAQLNGWPTNIEDWDFWLLCIINFWANDTAGYTYETGNSQPMWKTNK